MRRSTTILALPLILCAWALLGTAGAFAHCDTMDGPVVTTAKAALEKGDVTPVLKWVKQEYEAEIRTAFKKSLAVRTKGPEAKDLADMAFFETLVRIHRAGEGMPYTGILPAGTAVEPGIAAADEAVDSGRVDALVKEITEGVASGVGSRFARVVATKKRADENVAAGREYVEAYVTFIHYVEGLHTATESSAAHEGHTEHQ